MAKVTIIDKGLLTKVRINEVEIPGVIDYHFATTARKKPVIEMQVEADEIRVVNDEDE